MEEMTMNKECWSKASGKYFHTAGQIAWTHF